MEGVALTADRELRDRAIKVIPGGMWGHQKASRQPPSYPQFYSRAEGCRVWDVDGKSYIDFLCGWGPNIVGYGDPEIEEAVDRQRRSGDCMNGPSSRLVELAEAFTDLVPHAGWALFSKNGTDATTACVTIARAASGRRKVLLARGAYHGSAPWCTPSLVGVTAEDRAHLVHFDFNDVESIERAVAQARGDIAAILVSGFRHDLGIAQEMPSVEFAHTARRLADAEGAALIVDDVRAGLRLDLGGSWELVGVRPDLAAWSKAIANGHALAAVTGAESFRDAADRIYSTGSFWTASVPMAAGIATLARLKRTGAPARLAAMGQRLREGLEAQARRYGARIVQSGPAQMPLLQFENDKGAVIGTAFCEEALRRGVMMHPTHTMFLCLAHGEAEIDEALAATDPAMALAARLQQEAMA